MSNASIDNKTLTNNKIVTSIEVKLIKVIYGLMFLFILILALV